MSEPYEKDMPEDEDMSQSVEDLAQAVIGRKIVNVQARADSLILTLDDDTRVRLADFSNCCAYTELDSFLFHADKIDHVITGVTSEDLYTRWHILAGMEDVLELNVDWGEGSGFYCYGFSIQVLPAGGEWGE